MACFAKLELYNFLQRGSAPESEEKYASTQHASIRFVGLHVLYAPMGRVVRQNSELPTARQACIQRGCPLTPLIWLVALVCLIDCSRRR